jgi:hypothetical protein
MESENEDLLRALGEAVGSVWSRLPPNLQHDLFEAAVEAGGEGARERLAVFLHRQQPRAVTDRKDDPPIPTPDSLGG